MFGTQTLDVAISLIFIFLAMSLGVTALNELVAAWLKRRPKNLWRGAVRLLGDEGFARLVYAHPLISCLSQSPGAQPSYIPARTFVLAVLDVLTGAAAPPPANVQEVKAALATLTLGQQDLAVALTVILDDAAENMDDFKKGLEQWFDNSMERVTGWYKRQTQAILLVMAAGVTVWANADTIALANALWRDPAVRSALVTQAQQYAVQESNESESAQPINKDGPPPPPAESPSEAPEADPESKLEKSMARIENLALPLGWGNPADKNDPREAFPAAADIGITIAKHGLGWLMTTLAISLGAPFWFDMLNKVVSLRAAGKTPEAKPRPA